jgi:hypothetical protein
VLQSQQDVRDVVSGFEADLNVGDFDLTKGHLGVVYYAHRISTGEDCGLGLVFGLVLNKIQ